MRCMAKVVLEVGACAHPADVHLVGTAQGNVDLEQRHRMSQHTAQSEICWEQHLTERACSGSLIPTVFTRGGWLMSRSLEPYAYLRIDSC
jgi:hypothetical protein